MARGGCVLGCAPPLGSACSVAVVVVVLVVRVVVTVFLCLLMLWYVRYVTCQSLSLSLFCWCGLSSGVAGLICVVDVGVLARVAC